MISKADISESGLYCVFGATCYYAQKDHLGSIIKLTDYNGTVGFSATYDAWGRQTITNNTLKFHRGYTGHEHLPEFDLINMNGRMYNPILGRFLSPDPYVQAPEFSQSYNRYAYCINNPLIYTDPTGEKWKGWKWGVLDLLTRGAVSTTVGLTAMAAAITYGGIAAPTFFTALPKMNNAYIAGLIGGDKYPENRAKNAWKISMGLLKTDEDKNFLNRTWQVFSRHTWQQPMTMIGYEFANTANNWTQLNGVEYFHGATVILSDRMKEGRGISIGGYIGLNPNDGALNYDNFLLLHEYGHFLQTRQWGGIATLSSSIFSGLSAGFDWRSIGDHGYTWVERDANARVLSYFGKRLDNKQRRNFIEEYHGQYDDYRFIHRFLFPFLFPHFLYEDITFSD